MFRCILALFLITATPVLPADWNVRPWDEEMDVQAVTSRVVGQEILFMDGGLASYRDDGRYAYTYQGGRAFEGNYSIADDGSICVVFDSGRTRCDLYVLHGERLVMITEAGQRFPVAP